VPGYLAHLFEVDDRLGSVNEPAARGRRCTGEGVLGGGGREERFLAEKVYDGGDCRHELIRINYRNRFSDRI
jgi:hypothetical protein